MTFIHPIKVPHSAETAGGGTGPVGVVRGDVFCCHHSSPFFRPAVYQPAQFQVQLHLGQTGSKGLIDSSVKTTVIDVFPNIHGISSPGLWPYFCGKAKEKTAVGAAVLCFGLSPTLRFSALSAPRTGGRPGPCLWKGHSLYPPAGGWYFPPTG